MPATTGQIAAQSTSISRLRQTITDAMANLNTIQGNLLVVRSLGGFDAYDPAAFAGANGDLAATDLDAANTAIQAILGILYSSPGVPSANLVVLAKVAQ